MVLVALVILVVVVLVVVVLVVVVLVVVVLVVVSGAVRQCCAADLNGISAGPAMVLTQDLQEVHSRRQVAEADGVLVQDRRTGRECAKLVRTVYPDKDAVVYAKTAR